MKLTGSYKIPTDIQTVWQALNDPRTLQKCIPGCEELEYVGKNEIVAKKCLKSV